MKQYEIFELSFDMKEPKNLAQPKIEAVFTNGGKSTKVKGFYRDGKAVVRFLPECAGNYEWEISGAVKASGSEMCEPAEKGRGKVKAVGTHFEYANGEKYLPFGTTIYAFAHQTPELIEQTLDTLSKAPFNKVRLCLFPKHYDYNRNEPQYYAFAKKQNGKWNVKKPDENYWKNFEYILTRLNEMNIQADVILFHPYDRWGFSSLSLKESLIFLDTVIRHISAFPNVWWSMANEYDLMYAQANLNWHRFEKFITNNDPFKHLISNHNCFKPYDFSHKRITHVSIQSRYVARAQSLIKKFGKPVIFDECAYEGNLPHTWGNISGKELVNRFWTCVASGAYCTHGEVFLDENDILWWAKGGKLKGESPERIAFLRNIVESFNAPFEPFIPEQEVPVSFIDNIKCCMKEHPIATLQGLIRLGVSMLKTERQNQLIDEAMYRAACCGEDAYLYYYGNTCPGVTTLFFPEDKKYKIEIIDAWEMTRTTVCEDASGKAEIKLPSKECVAVLATKID